MIDLVQFRTSLAALCSSAAASSTLRPKLNHVIFCPTCSALTPKATRRARPVLRTLVFAIILRPFFLIGLDLPLSDPALLAHFAESVYQ